MTRPRTYQVTALTFYIFNPHRGLWEAYHKDENGEKHPINEYCETDTDALNSCIRWTLRNNSTKEPIF